MAIPGLTGGSSKPLLKYDAKARCFKVDDKVLNTLTAIIDSACADKPFSTKPTLVRRKAPPRRQAPSSGPFGAAGPSLR